MKILLFIFILCAFGVYFTKAMDSKAKLMPGTLKDLKDCEKFSKQQRFLVAKTEAYYDPKKNTFYMDPSYKYPLLKCAQYNKDNMLRNPTIIYKIKNVVDFGEGDVQKDMLTLEGNVDPFMEIIPQITLFVGPGGNKAEVAKNTRSISTSWAVIAPSERESLLTFYPQIFFNTLNTVDAEIQAMNKYLRLNGWHCRNIQKNPDLSKNLLSMFAGIIIWVDRAHAHQIGKNEAIQFLNGTTTIPVFYDMPDSPDHAGASQLEVMRNVVVIMGLTVGFVRWVLEQRV